jgi:urease accessory protein
LNTSDWLLWQLTDSALPVGAFAHSGGLEAAWQAGEVTGYRGLASFIAASLTQSGHGALPLVRAAHDKPQGLHELDRLCDAFINNHIANRASRAQGKACWAVLERILSGGARSFPALPSPAPERGHFAPVFGALTSVAGIAQERATRAFLFIQLRGLLSSAVRLGIIGPLEGQAMQVRLAQHGEAVAQRLAGTRLEDIAQTAPILDLLQATHDRLYSRLFQS